MADFFDTPYGDSGCWGNDSFSGQFRHLGLAVEGATAGCEDHPFGVGRPGPFEDPERAEDVHVGVEDRFGHRHPHVGLGGQVEHDLGAPTGHEVDHLGRADVHLVHGELMAGCGPGIAEIGQRAGGQVVEDVHGVPFGQQPIHQRRTDEPGPTGDQHAHGQTPAGTRWPSMTVPDAVTAPAPMTDRAWITQR